MGSMMIGLGALVVIVVVIVVAAVVIACGKKE